MTIPELKAAIAAKEAELAALRKQLAQAVAATATANGRIAIVVGHNSAAQGADRVTDGRSEYDWNGDLAEAIRALDPEHVEVFHRTYTGGYSTEIDRVYAASDAWGAACSIELHFNAATASATGTETLTSGTTGSRALAALVQSGMVSALGLRDRGLKTLAKSDRGGRSLWVGKAPAVLVEPYFGSNPDDCATADAHRDALARAIYAAACDYLAG